MLILLGVFFMILLVFLFCCLKVASWADENQENSFKN